MTFNEFLRDVRRGLFVVAFLFLILAIVQRGLMFLGMTLPGITIDPSAFLDWAFTTLAFVIALLLREILKAHGPTPA